MLTLKPTVQYCFSSRRRGIATHIVDIVDMIAENWAISTDAQPERMKEGEYPPPAPNGSTNAEASRRSMLTTGFERLRGYDQSSVSFR